MAMNGLTEIHISYSPDLFQASTVHYYDNGDPEERFFLIHADSTAQLVLKRVGPTNQLATALWLVLLTVFMQSHECTFEQAIKRVKDLVKWSKVGTRSEEIVTLIPSH
jgi:hypothetical protein